MSTVKQVEQLVRCAWVTDDPLYIRYHDEEWGVPCFDERMLFELLTLEGAQAGLSWLTILRKRENYRAAFDGFDPVKIAAYDQAKINALLQDAGIVRNRLKIQATITNARALLACAHLPGGFSGLIWDHVDGQPIRNHWRDGAEVPATTVVSDQLARTLKKRGFTFVGSTICYAFMQAAGLVNDHTKNCFGYGAAT